MEEEEKSCRSQVIQHCHMHSKKWRVLRDKSELILLRICSSSGDLKSSTRRREKEAVEPWTIPAAHYDVIRWWMTRRCFSSSFVREVEMDERKYCSRSTANVQLEKGKNFNFIWYAVFVVCCDYECKIWICWASWAELGEINVEREREIWPSVAEAENSIHPINNET